MNFARLAVHDWHAMGNVDLDLSNRTTIITGANGSGKTSLLRILAMHAKWVAVDYKIPDPAPGESAAAKLLADTDYLRVGTLEYSNEHGQKDSTSILSSSPGYIRGHLALQASKPVPSIFVSSTRSSFAYQPVDATTISPQPDLTPAVALEDARASQQRDLNGSPASMAGAMKKTLFRWMVGAYGIKSGDRFLLRPLEQYRVYFEGFEAALKKALPEQFKFANIEIAQNGEVVFACKDGIERFIVEGASGGFSSLIETIWMLYLLDLNVAKGEEYTAIIDELENHLHPSVQRTILPCLIDAFPRARFIVSTHSPLVVSSVPDAYVYALRPDDTGTIHSVRLDFKEKARTAAQILDEVLGVSVTLPVWAEDELKELVSKYANQPATANIFDNLRDDLRARGLEALAPEAIQGVLQKND
ncbi:MULTISPECIES: AAA family ATPase [unclassified Burkholderia]|uniref:AAA family ATPase n=1 Tax=unclassified Burkholderia TaxID=2613784 RepID=UPI0015CFC868|nr:MULTISPECIES: AAA family ATPase [unclassified Burkholderia]